MIYLDKNKVKNMFMSISIESKTGKTSVLKQK